MFGLSGGAFVSSGHAGRDSEMVRPIRPRNPCSGVAVAVVA